MQANNRHSGQAEKMRLLVELEQGSNYRENRIQEWALCVMGLILGMIRCTSPSAMGCMVPQMMNSGM